MGAPTWWSPPCKCGHGIAEHSSNRTSWPHPVKFGPCLHMEVPHEVSTICGCEEYTPDESVTYEEAA